MNASIETTQGLSDFWSVPEEDLVHRLRSTPQSVPDEVARRMLAGGPMHVIKAGPGRKDDFDTLRIDPRPGDGESPDSDGRRPRPGRNARISQAARRDVSWLDE
jgi:hypothetical protein